MSENRGGGNIMTKTGKEKLIWMIITVIISWTLYLAGLGTFAIFVMGAIPLLYHVIKSQQK